MKQQHVVVALKVVLWLGALTPGVWLVSGVFLGHLGANPLERLTRVSGMTALVLLLLTLAVTPVRSLTGWNPVIRLRRPLGLFAFFYAFSHFMVWFGFDRLFEVGTVLADVAERPYITVGAAALLILSTLAFTSTKGWIRRLGKRWASLHRGAYVAALLGVVHYYWLVKADTRLPILLGICLLVLLALRTPRLGRSRKGSRGGAAHRAAPNA